MIRPGPPTPEYDSRWMYLFWTWATSLGQNDSANLLGSRIFMGSRVQQPSVTVAGSEDILKNQIFGG